MNETRIVYCNCTYAQIIPKAVKEQVLRGLVESGVAFDAVADLCEMSAKKDPEMKRLAQSGAKIKIAACFPRSVNWLFHAADAPLPVEDVEIFNMRRDSSDSPEATLAALVGERSEKDNSCNR